MVLLKILGSSSRYAASMSIDEPINKMTAAVLNSTGLSGLKNFDLQEPKLSLL
jgi:hypothetical protein